MDAVSGEVTEIPLETEARWLLPTEDAIWVGERLRCTTDRPRQPVRARQDGQAESRSATHVGMAGR